MQKYWQRYSQLKMSNPGHYFNPYQHRSLCISLSIDPPLYLNSEIKNNEIHYLFSNFHRNTRQSSTGQYC